MQAADFDLLLKQNSSTSPRSALDLSRDELGKLLHPLSADQFSSQYFGRVPLYVEGDENKFHQIMNWEVLSQALVAGQDLSSVHYGINASFAKGETAGHKARMFPAYYPQLAALLNGGASICIRNLHLADTRLQPWLSSIQEQLGFEGHVGVNCYISPDQAGFAIHYDGRVATTLQISGVKRWRYSTEPAKSWPRHNAVYQSDPDDASEDDRSDIGRLPPEMEFVEVDMKPGDLLCLPAGTWHSARAAGHSLALNLYFQRDHGSGQPENAST